VDAAAGNRIALNEKKGRAVLKLDLSTGADIRGRQPIVTSTEASPGRARRWPAKGFSEVRYGTSACRGRPLVGFVAAMPDMIVA